MTVPRLCWRPLEISAAIAGLVILAPLILLVAAAVRLTSRGFILHWSERVGIDNRRIALPKFRTMRVDTPQVATHLLRDPEAFLTPVGSFLRRTSLDELPQLWSVIRGDLAFVGPRPALFNQADLIGLRTEAGVHRLRPGITGWAQINGRDTLSIPEKVALDREYLDRRSVRFNLVILGRTIVKVVRRDDVAH